MRRCRRSSRTRYGTAPEAVLRLAEIARPTIGDDEVLVRVAAASVDKGTWHVMTGLPYAMRLAGFGVRQPKAPNPGRSLAGTVESVGKNVTAFKPGDEVYGTCDGSFAEYARAKASKLAPKPANLSFEQAAAVPISGIDCAPSRPQGEGAARATGPDRRRVGRRGHLRRADRQGVRRRSHRRLQHRQDRPRPLPRRRSRHRLHAARTSPPASSRYDVIIDTGGNRRLSHLRRVMTRRGTLVIVGGETGGRWLGGFERSLGAVLLSPLVSQKLRMLASTENAADLRRAP